MTRLRHPSPVPFARSRSPARRGLRRRLGRGPGRRDRRRGRQADQRAPSSTQLLNRTKTAYKNAKRAVPEAGHAGVQRDQVAGRPVARAEGAVRGEGRRPRDRGHRAAVDKKLRRGQEAVLPGQHEATSEALKQQGYTEKQLRDTLRIQLIQDEIFKKVTEDVEVSDEDIKAFYDKNKAERYTSPASRDVRHILVAVCADSADEGDGVPVERQGARQADRRLRPARRAAASFAALAKKHSDDPSSKDTGGKLTGSSRDRRWRRSTRPRSASA